MHQDNFDNGINNYPYPNSNFYNQRPTCHNQWPACPICPKCPPCPPCPPCPACPTCPNGNNCNGDQGAIIPFASGASAALGTNTDNLARNVAILGFGDNATQNTTIDSPLSVIGDLQAFAFVVPHDGTITSIAATATGQSVIGVSPTITAHLYSAAINSSSFNPITGALVAFPAPANNATNGATQDLDINVTAGERILMVIYASDTNSAGVVNVFLNAGIAIEEDD